MHWMFPYLLVNKAGSNCFNRKKKFFLRKTKVAIVYNVTIYVLWLSNLRQGGLCHHIFFKSQSLHFVLRYRLINHAKNLTERKMIQRLLNRFEKKIDFFLNLRSSNQLSALCLNIFFENQIFCMVHRTIMNNKIKGRDLKKDQNIVTLCFNAVHSHIEY